MDYIIIDRSCNGGHPGGKSRNFGLSLENDGVLGRDRHFALQHVIDGPPKELLQATCMFLTCRPYGIRFRRSILCYVLIFTGRCCLLAQPKMPSRSPLTKILLPIGSRTKWPYVYSLVTLGGHLMDYFLIQFNYYM